MEAHSTVTEMFVLVVKGISIYYSLFVIVAGLICNPLSFVVFSQKGYRHKTTAVYLRFLSVIDLGAILSGHIRYFLRQAFQMDVGRGIISCQVSIWFPRVFLFCSSWTLVAVTAERVISILWPHRVRQWCKMLTVKLTITLGFAIISLSCTPYIFLYESKSIFNSVSNTTVYRGCYMTDSMGVSLQVMNTVDGTFFAFIPSLILICFNVIILRGVLQSRKKVQKTTVRNRLPHKQCSRLATSRVTSSSEGQSDVRNNYPRNNEKNDDVKDVKGSNNVSDGSKSKRDTSLALTLIVINTAFIVCNFPVCIYGQVPPEALTSSKAIDRALADLFNILMHTNNALNFFLYCITGSKFRAELKDLCLACFRPLFS